jgi:hypothetical protein
MMMNQPPPSPTLINSDCIKSTLETLGYKLLDCGNHWRTNAVFRGGDNPTALQIYKNTGVWTDYTHNRGSSRPLEALLKLTLKGDQKQVQEVIKNIQSGEVSEYQPKELIVMDKVYPKSSLQKLFPNYKYYESRGISEKTQRFFQTGLAGAGQMYRRMVFPIYDENTQIVGFSGRRVDNNVDKVPKWKHIGKKRKWIFPAYVPADKTVDSIIDDKGSVYLIESIGDAMALYDQGVKNILVTFGITISNELINYLCSKNLKKIYISTNNDLDTARNNGLIGAIQIYVKLSSFFNLDQLEIRLPPKPHNDFSEAHENGYNLTNWVDKVLDIEDQRNYIFNYVKTHKTLFPAKSADKFLKLHE